jgi:hypothetical protein
MMAHELRSYTNQTFGRSVPKAGPGYFEEIILSDQGRQDCGRAGRPRLSADGRHVDSERNTACWLLGTRDRLVVG